jgi:YD repeat-containing protein
MARLKTMVTFAVGAVVATAGVAVLSSTAGASETINYTYDAKGRLILVVHSGTVNNGVIANYTLDHADNRKNIKVTGAP